MTQEITLTLEENLIYKAERFAAKQSLSLRQMLSDLVARVIVELDESKYERAKHRAFTKMENGYHLGGTPAPRETLYDR